MNITIDMIKQLREATAAGMGACKEALKAEVLGLQKLFKGEWICF